MKIQKEIYEVFLEIAKPILNNSVFTKQKKYFQHGNTTLYNHVINVSLRSFKKAWHKAKKNNLRAIVYGGLLHDFYDYDWHIKKSHKRFHGINHPKIALANAKSMFSLSKKEENIILSHMWPLNFFTFPKSKEAWSIVISDKICTILETLRYKRIIEIC